MFQEEDKFWNKNTDKNQKKMDLNLIYNENIRIKVNITANISLSIFEIIKSVIFSLLFTEEERLSFRIMMLLLLKRNNILPKDDFNKAKKLQRKFYQIFQVRTKISLIFLICSKSFSYVFSKRLTEQENNILNLLALGYTKEEAGIFLNIKFGTVCGLLAKIFTKLQVQSTEEALVSVLKENNMFKDPCELINDKQLFQITVTKPFQFFE
jgi:DNA-binding CsgD family transcriptional regulator